MGVFLFSSRRRHTKCRRDWSSDVCSSDLVVASMVFALSAPSLALASILTHVTEFGSMPTLLAKAGHMVRAPSPAGRSEERRVGKEVCQPMPPYCTIKYC